jgi:glutathione S-transferase
VLVLPSGEVLEQSLDIMRWAFAQTTDADGWWARAQTPEHLALQQACDGVFKHHLDRFKYPQRYADATDREHHRQQAVSALLEPLEQRLRTQAQLGGDTPCAADIGIFPFVRQFAAVDPERFKALPLPAVKAWLAAWLESGLFAEAMRKSAL